VIYPTVALRVVCVWGVGSVAVQSPHASTHPLTHSLSWLVGVGVHSLTHSPTQSRSSFRPPFVRLFVRCSFVVRSFVRSIRSFIGFSFVRFVRSLGFRPSVRSFVRRCSSKPFFAFCVPSFRAFVVCLTCTLCASPVHPTPPQFRDRGARKIF